MLSITFFNDIEGIDLGQKFLQVFAGSFENKNRKRGEGKAETEVGFPSRDMIEGIQIQVQEWPLPRVKSSELREWHLHCCPKVFNFPSCIPIDEDFDFTYAIAVLEPSNHITHGATGLNEER